MSTFIDRASSRASEANHEDQPGVSDTRSAVSPGRASLPSRWLFNPNRSFRFQLIAIALVPVALSLMAAVVAQQVIQTMGEMERQMDRTASSIVVGYGLQTAILDAQTGLRGFVITGEERFLAPYDRALENFEVLSSQAREHWRGDPVRMEVLDRIETQFALYRSQVAEPLISRAESVPSGDINGPVRSGQDKLMVDELRQMIRELIAHEQASLAGELAVGERRWALAFAAAIGGPLFAVGVTLFLLALVLVRVVRGLDRLALGSSQVEGGDLSQRLLLNDNRELAQAADGFNRMADALERRRRHSVSLDQMSRTLQSCRTTSEAYAVASRFLPQVLPDSVSGAVFVYRASRDRVEPVSQWGDDALQQVSHGFEPDECWALRSGHVYQYTHEGGPPPCAHIDPDAATASLCVPIISGKEVLGVLVLAGHDKSALDAETVALSGVLSESLALTIVNLQLREALRNQSIRDPLTGLYNRRFLDESLGREIARSQRSELPMSVVVLDVDHFKRFNDIWGHDAGDSVLKALAQLMVEQVREMDSACRLGGEEFLLLLPRTGANDALTVAERVRTAAERLVIEHKRQPLEAVTLSLGVATYPEHAEEPDELIQAADRALYKAKTGGRNRVERP